ncbi:MULTISPECIES: nucleotidyltransferase [Mucilaginibacter]|uniref:nucleotidyltransferase n=1 Tax=Mucilaginibacter TaxID=423349 RepID=UPI002091DBE3|nr:MULTISPECIES: nucleotidyltransferase [Mucilaginibacter]MCO5936828.1 nucleotidyltransferase [Mucilaginibacter aurantiaciroseus]MEB0262565.1 nucleotidyltransferase [Mucilaginibacter sp. 10I4]MEB0278404.1 nucleotidyltransferase [Mucilaginibacter sp. 10B2]MEB0302237.1 nucleotidyltransferase [Mucilaginibacter sp. 5C4]WPX24049.1 nucleotidyltransferase [Mucilaginibacter sp. 5C4]
MNLFIEKHQGLLKELLLKKVDFIVIGGYSVIFHGYARSTGDVDLWLRPDNVNKLKLLDVLRQMNFDEEDILHIAELDFKKHIVFSMWDEPEKVDFLTRISMIEFEQADQRKIIADIDGVKIPFLHLSDLVLSKFNTGRLKDKADIEELQKIQQEKGSTT